MKTSTQNQTVRERPALQARPSTRARLSIRARGQWPAIAGAVVVVLFTFGAAAANLPSGPPPSARQLMREELDEIVHQRRVRITELQAAAPGERCHPPSAHELARLLVMDGQWPAARRFADDYERRCGEDPVVRKWGDAPRP